MGQKTHPKGLRLGIIRTWDSRWYAEKKQYVALLQEDLLIRKFIRGKLRNAAISTIEIERTANRIKIIVHTAKPGIVIGRSGSGVDRLKAELEALVNKDSQLKLKTERKGKDNTEKQVQISVQEVFQPELDGFLVAENIAMQIVKRISFRRAMKQAVMRSMRAGAKGIKVMVSGRLGGSEIARHEGYKEGKIPLHTLRADIDYGFTEAVTPYGQIGVKVWIYKGDIMDERHTMAVRSAEMKAVAAAQTELAVPPAVEIQAVPETQEIQGGTPEIKEQG